ncbi:Hint domain-containing protein [Salinibacterium sp. ZJ454]|uniref:Hint domain-containing protein n=1 Tax=Salinibacterium sp. ZJ454 TaxID=2708339 RepID=UPI0014226CB6|nr:Hint domain-containing protein [Salinibacterium sp. ZJ454]
MRRVLLGLSEPGRHSATMVYSTTRNALVPIGEIKVGERVQGVNPDYSPAEGEVTAWCETGVQDTVTTIVETGQELRSAPDHLVLTPAGWIEVGSLQPGDVIASPWSTSTALAPTAARLSAREAGSSAS